MSNYVSAIPDEELTNIFQVIGEQVDMTGYCSRTYWDWEDNVAKPALEAAGYKVIKFMMGEADSSGPLSRIVVTEKDGKRVYFVYN
jgi:hypothetical protein